MDSLVESEGEPELPLERGMIASTVAYTLTHLAFCERELRACKPISPDGCWAAALRYIRLARQMLEAAECDQGHVIDEVDIQEESNFPLRKVASYGKKTAVTGLGAGATKSGDEVGPIVRSESADFDLTPVAQRLYR